MAPYQEGIASHYTVSGFLVGHNIHTPTIVSHNHQEEAMRLGLGHNSHLVLQPDDSGSAGFIIPNPDQNLDGSYLSIITGSDIPAETPSGEFDATSESLIVVCTLLVPFLVGFGVIISVALLIRKMRRAKSLKEVSVTEPEEIPMPAYQTPRPITREYLSMSQVLGLDLDPLELDSITPDCQRVSSAPCNLEEYRNPKPLPVEENETGQRKGKGSMKRSLKRSLSMKNLSMRSFGSRVLHVLTFPKRMRQKSAERKRFNIYTISVETREQLKQIYVY